MRDQGDIGNVLESVGQGHYGCAWEQLILLREGSIWEWWHLSTLLGAQ